MRDGHGETLGCGLPAAGLEPGRLFVTVRNDDDFICGKQTQAVLDRLQGIRVADVRLGVIGLGPVCDRFCSLSSLDAG